MSSASENLRESVREHLTKVQREILGLPDSPAIKLDAIKQARGLDKKVRIVNAANDFQFQAVTASKLQEAPRPVSENSLQANIKAALGTLKTHGAQITAVAVAAELGVASQALYEDRDLLQAIYQAALTSEDYHDLAVVSGADALVHKLLKELKSQKQKITRLQSELNQTQAEIKKTYADAFAKGAAIHYGEASSGTELHLEKWARGILFLDQSEALDTEKIKKAYRRLLTIVHPDQSARDTGSLMTSLQSAYRYLLERYEA